MKSRTAFFIFVMVLSLGLLFVTTERAMSGEKTTIRIGSPFKAGHILVDAAEKFKELAESRSGGRIEVQIDAGAKEKSRSTS